MNISRASNLILNESFHIKILKLDVHIYSVCLIIFIFFLIYLFDVSFNNIGIKIMRRLHREEAHRRENFDFARAKVAKRETFPRRFCYPDRNNFIS